MFLLEKKGGTPVIEQFSNDPSVTRATFGGVTMSWWLDEGAGVCDWLNRPGEEDSERCDERIIDFIRVKIQWRCWIEMCERSKCGNTAWGWGRRRARSTTQWLRASLIVEFWWDAPTRYQIKTFTTWKGHISQQCSIYIQEAFYSKNWVDSFVGNIHLWGGVL